MDEKTILAVDDSPEILESLNSILGDEHDVRLAKTASAAWTVLNMTKVDVILLDIEMPGMTGFEFLDTIHTDRTEYKDIPVVFVSSNSEQETIDRAFSKGAAGYMVKPFMPGDLRNCVQNALNAPQGEA
jgi:putative two-component system response regulator